MTRAWHQREHILSGERVKHVRKRVRVERRHSSGWSTLATSIHPHRLFTRLIGWLFAAVVLMIAIGCGLFEVDWAGTARDLLQRVSGR